MKQNSEEYHSQLIDLLKGDSWRMDLLGVVEMATDGQGWIGGGFIRHLVWDSINESGMWTLNDIDVLFLGGGDRIGEEKIYKKLNSERPEVLWSVKDQIRMAHKHGHKEYNTIEEAISHWVEKCTAVAVKTESGEIQIASPYGLSDLFNGIISPTSLKMKNILSERAVEKGWLEHYPFLKIYT